MKVSLATSLHLAHGVMTLDHQPGDRLPMQSFVPTGLLCLKAYADAHGVDADIRVTELNGLINSGFVPNDDRFYERLADLVLEPGDGMVGLMTDADSLHHTVGLARIVKARSPETVVCLGGPASSPISRLLMERFPFVDLVVRGEAEVTFTELLRCTAAGRHPEQVAGLTWRCGDSIVENPERPVLDDLDQLPLPVFEAYGMDPDAGIYLDVGRGCPFKCHFCATAPFWKRRFRMKSIERIVTELTTLRDRYHRNHVGFAHDIFTADKRWTLRFCRYLVDNPIRMTWACSTRTDVIDAEMLEAMAAAGCTEIYYGIESGSQEMQSVIHKGLDLSHSRDVVEWTAAAGIRPTTGFIVGYPMETRRTLEDTLTRFFEFLQVGGYRAHLFTLCPFQEAPMYRDGHAIDRQAGYFEMPLTAVPADTMDRLRTEHPDIFTSLYRFQTPGVDSRLVDGSEEISSRLVAFKSLWPHLLPHYSSPLEWYERWIDWIGAYNARERPATKLPYHGEVEDLAAFLEGELGRLGLLDSPVDSLLRYECDKLDAMRDLRTFPGREPEAHEIGDLSLDHMVARGCDFVVRPLRHDLSALLSTGEARLAGDRVAVFAKVEGEDMLTVQLSGAAGRLLSQASRPRRIRDLARDGVSEDDALRIVRALVKRGLLTRIDYRAACEGGTMPGSRGEHELQDRFDNVGRAYGFYNNQMLDHLNELMCDYIARQSMFFIGTSDRYGNCDCSLRAGPPGVMRVLDERTLIYPEYRGNGVMASLGNIAENPHVGVFFADFFASTIGLHVNGSARLVTHEAVVAELAGREDLQAEVAREAERRLETWVRIEVDEAYIHCSKHIPLLRPLEKNVSWGTDDREYKGGDHFHVRFRTSSKRPPTPTPLPKTPVS